jgi:hypothetical protein
VRKKLVLLALAVATTAAGLMAPSQAQVICRDYYCEETMQIVICCTQECECPPPR